LFFPVADFAQQLGDVGGVHAGHGVAVLLSSDHPNTKAPSGFPLAQIAHSRAY